MTTHFIFALEAVKIGGGEERPASWSKMVNLPLLEKTSCRSRVFNRCK